MKPATQRARETAERILKMQSDRTDASLTARSIPDVIQSAMDMQTAEHLQTLSDMLVIIDDEALIPAGLKGAASQICRIKIKLAKTLEGLK